jgi:hypothetical protein
MADHDPYEHDPYEHEPHAAMCQRTDAAFAAMEASACSRMDALESDSAVLGETQEADPEPLKTDKKETPKEIWKRISHLRQAKLVKSVKTAAKKLVKQRKIRKISDHFSSK